MAFRFWLLLGVLTVGIVSPAHAAFPGANGKLAFTSYTDGQPTVAVMLINEDGSGLQQVARGADYYTGAAAFSPNGRFIAFMSDGQLAEMRADGTDVRLLGTDGLPGSYSPDGGSLVFSRFSGNGDLFRVPVAGGEVTQLTESSSGEGAPDWSPDGERIAFTSSFNTVSWQSEIYAMKADGSEDLSQAVKLTNTLGTDASADYSPDGSKIAFSTNRDGQYEIYVMNADGSNETRLTTHVDNDEYPEWSPDGTEVAFTRMNLDPPQRQQIWVMNADGTAERQITSSDTRKVLTDWQPLQNGSPDCSGVAAAPAQIDKHNGTFVAVSLSGGSDPDGDTVSLAVTGVTQDEPVGGAPDARAGAVPSRVRLRAERENRGDGRVYRIAFEASDGNGGTCTGTATVGVPRKKGTAAVDSAPPSYDSFGP